MGSPLHVAAWATLARPRLGRSLRLSRERAQAGRRTPQKEPLWHKDAIIYKLHVRAFHDNNADGIGDSRGLTEKLGYIQDLLSLSLERR